MSALKSKTDEFDGYKGLDKLDRSHETVNHGKGEFVRYVGKGKDRKTIMTNGCESTFGSLKANIVGVYHHISVKHLHHYLDEQSGNRNSRNLDTIDKLAHHACDMIGKRIRYDELTARILEQVAAYL